jgi:hypothetical protein
LSFCHFSFGHWFVYSSDYLCWYLPSFLSPFVIFHSAIVCPFVIYHSAIVCPFIIFHSAIVLSLLLITHVGIFHLF